MKKLLLCICVALCVLSCGAVEQPPADEILKMVSKVLQSSVRGIDLIGRWGGEEFVGIIQVSDQRQLKIISEKLRKNIESSSYDHEGLEIKITVSIGGCLYKSNEKTTLLISRADTLMYHAKEEGRNRVYIK